MLESIKITNLALIEKSVVTFGDGFNVLTGETGAGKSLIVDALLFLTGIRADRTLIKQGQDFARVEGVFSVNIDNDAINQILDTVNLENEGTLIISRYFSVNGKNECRINGEIVTLNILRKLSNEIIDIFGQNDSQVLLSSENHLLLLDDIFDSQLTGEKNKLCNKLDELKLINNSIKELGGLDKDREGTINYIQYQINSIEEAQLYDGLEEELKSKILIMQNSEKIYSALNDTIGSLDGEYSVSNIIKMAINNLNSIISFDDEYQNVKDRLYNIKYELDDIVDNINAQRDQISYSEEELDIAQDRLLQIKDLERKFGNTIAEVLNKKEEFVVNLERLKNADEELERLRLEKKKVLCEILSICNTLHQIRVEEIDKFRLKLIDKLKELGMKNADFNVRFISDFNIDNIESLVTSNGADEIEFLFSANLGVELRPLNKIISGGEMSRFMLAFKSLQNANSQKTCIFDEIDTGIGGEVGAIVGKKICEISKNCQVICITHLAQIASFGDSNFKIEKFDENNQTITSVKLLREDEKIVEIARMLGNSNSDTSINLAKQIIDDSNAYKSYISN